MTGIYVDDISEATSAHGVEIDGVTLKDGGGTFTGNVALTRGSATSSLTRTITIGGAENASTNKFGELLFQNYDSNGSATDYVGASISAFVDNDGQDGGELSFSTSTETTVGEKMRIDSGGNLKFNSGFGSVGTAYGCRAWVFYDQTNDNVLGSGNVSSVTDNGTGSFRINFTNSMPDANYCALGGSNKTAGDTSPRMATLVSGNVKTTSALEILVEGTDGTNSDETNNSVAIFR